MVLAPLIIMDQYTKEKHQKMMNMFNGFCTIGICVAPIIGSYSTLYFGWQGSFAILSILGIVSILMFSIFVKNDKPKTNEIEVHIREYFIIFQSPITRLYLFALSLSIAAYYTFVGMAPIIYIESLGVSLEKFGLYQGSLTLTFCIFSVLADPISKLIGKKNAFNISIILILISLCTSLSIIILNISDPLIITYSILIISVGVVIPVNVMYVSALASIEGAGGRISAMITIGKWVMTMAGIQIASFFYTNDFKSSPVRAEL
jgi:DHA1 family bicyclomycin/chloramphenicol resistance-like MFS transporter